MDPFELHFMICVVEEGVGINWMHSVLGLDLQNKELLSISNLIV